MAKKKCTTYKLIREDVLWIFRHIGVYYVGPAIILLQFLGGSGETTMLMVKGAFIAVTIELLIRAKKHL